MQKSIKKLPLFKLKAVTLKKLNTGLEDWDSDILHKYLLEQNLIDLIYQANLLKLMNCFIFPTNSSIE